MSVLSKALFVERMKECIDQSEWSRGCLAAELGVSKATVGRWLTQGKTHQYPSLCQFVEICDLLGVSQAYITIGAGPMRGPHDEVYRATYRRYVEDREFAALTDLVQTLPAEALPPLTEVLAHLLRAAPKTAG